MNKKYHFPFGQELKKVEQKDKTPKNAFVLGVYASAVHARWIDKNGKLKVTALAVASEPEIFWNGNNAENIINKIRIPNELGKLTLPKDIRLNGPSGRALDRSFLSPLDLTRQNTWLCDLLPESRVNNNQQRAIRKNYTKDIVERYNLKPATIPVFNRAELNSKKRIDEILVELEMSKAEKLILLGDLPIYYFIRHFNKKYSRLVQFGNTSDSYGREHEIKINDKIYQIIPLCHPRQAHKLGASSNYWKILHDNWINRLENE